MKKQTLNIQIIYFLKFFADALFSGYLTMYFASFFDRYSFEYGILLGIIPFCALLGNLIWGALSKNVKRNLFLIRIVIGLEILSLFAFVGFGTNFPTLLIFTILVSLFNSPYFTLQDGLGSAYSKKENTSYSSIRILGSMGYLFALIAGAGLIYLLENNYLIIFIIAGCIYLICLIIWFFVKPFDDVSQVEKEKVKYREVIKNKTFIFYFIFYILLIGSHNVADSYLFSRMNEIGLNQSLYSLVFALEVLLEIITMFVIIKYIKEKYYTKILYVSAFILFLRTFLFGFNFPLPFLICIAPLRGVGWGGFLTVHLITVRKIVSPKLVTKSISILTIALSLVNGLITLFGTKIYSILTLPGFYLLLSGLQLIGICILYRIKFNKLEIEKEKENENSNI